MKTSLAEVVLCSVCHQPINQGDNSYADEKGSPAHEGCYVPKILAMRKPMARAYGESRFDSMA
jgi:hypothetical protein